MTSPFPFQFGSVLQAQQLNDITNLPINDQTASYSLVVGDAGKRVVMNVATDNTVTVDDDIFSVGDTIFVANKGAGASTLTAGAGVTINSASGLVLVAHQSGQLVALSASSFLFVLSAAGSSGVVQVKSTTKTDAFSITRTTTPTDVTGLSVSITPTSATNKVFVLVSLSGSGTTAESFAYYQIVRGSTAIGIGDTAGNRSRVTGLLLPTSSDLQTSSATILDSPATTSVVTYKVQVFNFNGGGSATMNINRTSTDANTSDVARGISTITVMEVTP